jgi:AraC-like DNA-binding protein
LSDILSHGITSAVPPDETVVAGTRWLAQHPHGQLKQLSRGIGISERQLHRRFFAALGYGPKLFQSVLRFQRFLYWIARDSHSLAHVAASVGYADQSHMTREVGRFTGDRPTAFLHSSKCTLRFSDLLQAK